MGSTPPTPQAPTPSPVWTYDWDQYLGDRKLSADTERLFSKKADQIEYWQGPQASDCDTGPWNGPQTHVITGSDLSLIETQSEMRDTFFIIRQGKTSWDRFRVSQGTFRKLLAANNVFVYFMRTVHAFGSRTKEGIDTWDNFHWRASGPSDEIVELCYTVRFYERNNRGDSDPWSERQVGLYQRIHGPSQGATWIVLQHSDMITTSMVDKLKCLSRNLQSLYRRHVSLHLSVLWSSLQNWDDYLESQASELEKLEKKAYFLKLDGYEACDYLLTFADRQRLQMLRCKLMRGLSLIAAAICLGETMKANFCDTGVLEIPAIQSVQVEFDDYINKARYHKQCISDLLDRSKEIASLLSNMLEYRTGKSTLGIAKQGKVENKLARRDSANIKSLTIVATLYLPASLLSAIFSSNLVQASSDQDGNVYTHFVVAHDFWKFIVVLIPMILGTFAIVTILQVVSARTSKRDLESAFDGEDY